MFDSCLNNQNQCHTGLPRTLQSVIVLLIDHELEDLILRDVRLLLLLLGWCGCSPGHGDSVSLARSVSGLLQRTGGSGDWGLTGRRREDEVNDRWWMLDAASATAGKLTLPSPHCRSLTPSQWRFHPKPEKTNEIKDAVVSKNPYKTTHQQNKAVF